jgi:hypothetical protein
LPGGELVSPVDLAAVAGGARRADYLNPARRCGHHM